MATSFKFLDSNPGGGEAVGPWLPRCLATGNPRARTGSYQGSWDDVSTYDCNSPAKWP